MPIVLLLLTQGFFDVGAVFIDRLQVKFKGKANLGGRAWVCMRDGLRRGTAVILKAILG